MKEKISIDTYDRGIIPAETAARIKREGVNYKHLPTEEVGDLFLPIWQNCQ
jgi:hypothetical protein